MSNNFVDAMKVVATEAEREPAWHLYGEWCRARMSHLAEQAEAFAKQFSEAARRWPFDERKRFALWLVNSTGSTIDRRGGMRFKSRYSHGGRAYWSRVPSSTWLCFQRLPSGSALSPAILSHFLVSVI
jgi:hypothetical protein